MLPTPQWPSRAPTGPEQAAATQLAQQLDSAADRGADITAVPTIAPPGRLSTSELLQARAQAARGVPVMATPFRRTQRRQRRSPAMRVGIVVDRSPSMNQNIDGVAGAAWALWKAGTITRNCASHVEVATFAREAALLRSRDLATRVPLIDCPRADGRSYSGALPAALTILDHHLGLSTAVEDSRLVVVLSDSALDNTKEAAAALDVLRGRGVHVAWISVDEDPAHALDAWTVNPGDLLHQLPAVVVQTLAATPTPKGFL